MTKEATSEPHLAVVSPAERLLAGSVREETSSQDLPPGHRHRRYRGTASRVSSPVCESSARQHLRAPRANAFIERWIGTARRECLDRILIVNRRHLERVLPVYIRQCNEHRPHRSLHQRPPIKEPPPGSEIVVALDRVRHRDVLGGLIHEYKAAA
ncbi:MAG: integrase core domain-containing protein [Gaiellaceae bacterium]